MALKPYQVQSSDEVEIVLCEFLSNDYVGVALRSLIAELLNLHRGQGLDILWRDTLMCPTEDQYIDMVNKSEFGT